MIGDKTYYTSIAVLLFLFSPLVTVNSNSHAYLFPDYRISILNEIYQKLGTAINDNRKLPKLNFINGDAFGEPVYNAHYNFANNTINFGDGLYAIASQLGSDSINVIAALLGHELGHFYKKHQNNIELSLGAVQVDFPESNNPIESLEPNQQDSATIATQEMEADYYGVLFAFLAGYKVEGRSARFFNALQKKLNLTDFTAPNYPSFSQRKKMIDRAEEGFRKLNLVLETANILALATHHEEADRLYNHLLKLFPSREVYNNSGFNLVQMALNLYQKPMDRFHYPFSLDLETILPLNQKSQSRTGSELTDKERKERIIDLLKRAKYHFDQSILRVEQYLPAYINAALVNHLLGDDELGAGLAQKCIRLAQEQDSKLALANAKIAKGICLASINKTKDAKICFEAAKPYQTLIAQHNMDVLKGKKLRSKNKMLAASLEFDYSIGGINILDFNTEAMDVFEKESIYLLAQSPEKSKLGIIDFCIQSFSNNKAQILIVDKLDKELKPVFLKTQPNHPQATKMNIRIGQSLKDLFRVYGKAHKIVSGFPNNYYLYNNKEGISQMIFLISEKQEIVGWVICGEA